MWHLLIKQMSDKGAHTFSAKKPGGSCSQCQCMLDMAHVSSKQEFCPGLLVSFLTPSGVPLVSLICPSQCSHITDFILTMLCSSSKTSIYQLGHFDICWKKEKKVKLAYIMLRLEMSLSAWIIVIIFRKGHILMNNHVKREDNLVDCSKLWNNFDKFEWTLSGHCLLKKQQYKSSFGRSSCGLNRLGNVEVHALTTWKRNKNG